MVFSNKAWPKFFVPLSLSLAFLTGAQAGEVSPQEQAVLAPVHALFAGMAARDADAILRQTVPGGSLTLMRKGKPVHMTFAEFATRVSQPAKERIEERIHEPLIRVDDDVAVVWAPFSFYVNGKINHCGTDLFSLVKLNGSWRIASVSDTSRDACPAR